MALSANQEVFSFGVNNKGQCGREFVASSNATSAASAYRQEQQPAAAGGPDGGPAGEEANSDLEGEIDVEALGEYGNELPVLNGPVT